MAKRGRKSVPCPDPQELLAAYAFDPRLVVVARQMDSNPKTVRRWLLELGVAVPAPKKIRRHGAPTAFVRIVEMPDGRRVTSRLYNSFVNMHRRCNSETRMEYQNYGARGIKICAEWLHNFEAFRAWALANGFRKGVTIDRIDGNLGYFPANCRWATPREQTYNTKSVHKLTVNGVTKLLPIWAQELGVTPTLLRSRRREGWTDEQIVLTPKGAPRIGYTPKPRGRKPKARVGEGFRIDEGANQ